jgi:hypothetical protein
MPTGLNACKWVLTSPLDGLGLRGEVIEDEDQARCPLPIGIDLLNNLRQGTFRLVIIEHREKPRTSSSARMDSEGRESAPSPASIVAQYTV